MTSPTPPVRESNHPDTGQRSDVSVEQAKRALSAADSAEIDQSEGRSVYVLANAGFGVLFGAYFTLSKGAWLGSSVAVSAGYIIIACAIAGWQAHAARAVPKGARAVGRWGVALTLVVMIVALGFVNSPYRDGPAPGWLLPVAGFYVATPLLVSAVVIRRKTR